MCIDLSNKMPTRKRKWLLGCSIATITLLSAIILDTKIIKNGSIDDLREQAFSPQKFAQQEYPATRDFILNKAVAADTLLTELRADKKATIAKYGIKSGIGAIMPVRIDGIIKSGRSGIYTLKVSNMPDNQSIRVQVGPAINGTALRDATGKIVFGQFTNQIQYQDVGAAFNQVMKAEVLTDIDQSTLVGKHISTIGVFRLINAKNWLITPVRFDVK